MRLPYFQCVCAGLAMTGWLAAQDAPPAAEPASPVVERTYSFTIDAGYRFVHTLQGDPQSYRSVVNLGEGPKLFGIEALVDDPGSKIYDRLTVSAHGWGGDPYSTLRVDLEKNRTYRLTADYRDISYFNFLPSFADPFQATGGISERTYDLGRRYANVELELFPTRMIVPYLAWSRDSGNGTGIIPFVVTANEYPVRSDFRDSTNEYRGGVRINGRKWNLTLEQGGATFKDDQSNSQAGGVNTGNRVATLLGQQLFLSDLTQAYGVRGKNLYSKAVLTAAPASWANLYLQFQHSRPTSDVHYSDSATGLFYLGATRFFSGLGTLLDSEAKMPRSSAAAGFEVRIGNRVRVTEAWTTDRYHNASSALLAEQFLVNADSASLDFLAARLVLNYNRQEANIFFELPHRLTLRGGHRYVWGNASVPPHFLAPNGQESGEIRQQVALAGLSWRPAAKISANIDYEGSPGDKQYFRTSLDNYNRVRARARWQALSTLSLSAAYTYLSNDNPLAGSGYEFESRSATATLEWRPRAGKWVNLLGEYTRSSLRSDIGYLVPQALQPARSVYRDNAHTATGMLEVHIPGSGVVQPYLNVGGSLFLSSGTRPANYWQPVGRVYLPLHKNLEGYAEWRWYGLTQAFYLFEGFRSHQFTSGLRLTM